MNHELEQKVHDIGVEYDLTYVSIYTSSGKLIASAGEFDQIKDAGLYGYLLSTPIAVENLFQSLDGQLLPRSFAQGSAYCYVSKKDNLLIAWFSTTLTDPVLQYEKSLQVEEALYKIVAELHE